MQHWVTLSDVSGSDAREAISEFTRICAEHDVDEQTADVLWAASQMVLSHLLQEHGELPQRDETTAEPWESEFN